MPVPRATHEALKAAHAALRAKHTEVVTQQAAARRDSASTATTITRLSAEAATLRAVLGRHIRELERAGLTEQAYDLRQEIANAGVDITPDLDRQPTGRPAAREFTTTEGRLIADSYRARKTAGAFEDQCLTLQRINEEQARQLRAYSEAGGAA